MTKEREACGRCGVSVVVETAEDEDSDHDPFGENRIEVDSQQLRLLSPGAWLKPVVDRLDAFVQRVVWRRE